MHSFKSPASTMDTLNPLQQINQLSTELTSEFKHPSNVSLRRENGHWHLSNSRKPGDPNVWEKSTTQSAEGLAVQFFKKNGLGNGLVELSKGFVTRFTAEGLKHFQQKAPEVGDTLRLAISQKGQVALAIPNLEEGSVLSRAGVTAEDLENLTTSLSAIRLDPRKEQAIALYWKEITQLTDEVKTFDSSDLSLSRNPDDPEQPITPYFNLSAQTHYPQHLRLKLSNTPDFSARNPFFDFKSGLQTELLVTTANILNQKLFPDSSSARRALEDQALGQTTFSAISAIL
jgi:hypothetical protein